MVRQGKRTHHGVVSWAAFRSKSVSLGHFHPNHQCGICGEVFKFNDRCVGLLGNPQSTASWLCTRPFLYPHYVLKTVRAVDGWALCRRPDCAECASSPEAASMHLDCFELFRQSYLPINALDRLWRVAAWRKPWRGSPALVLPEGSIIGSGALAEVAERYGLAGLGRMPPEIIQLIQDDSASALFWRLIAPLDLAARFKALPVDYFIIVPLRELAGWERGSLPLQSKDLGHLPIVRLTIDSRGIRKVERLPAGEPKFSSERFDNMAFIITDVTNFEGVVALFKEGRVRLNLPEDHPGFQIWDTPTPPSLPPPHGPPTFGSRVYGNMTQSTRFSTIDLSSISGLTFFFSNGTFSAIHAHTRAAPHAIMPPESRSRRTQRFVCWVYVPIPPKDQVLAVAFRATKISDLRRRHSILLHTKLAGDISVGPWGPQKCSVRILASPPKTLIYNREERANVSVIGAYPEAASSSGSKHFETIESPQHCPFTFPNAWNAINFSSAPLDNVTGVETFLFNYRREGSFCRGLILTYENGAQRALGDCRLGVDLSRTYKNPQILCVLEEWSVWAESGREMTRLVKLQFAEDYPHSHDHPLWKCYKMSGNTLQFWFNHEKHCVQVLSG